MYNLHENQATTTVQSASSLDCTSIAFLIILASNSAGVNMSPMISLSKFFDSSDFKSFIRSLEKKSYTDSLQRP